MYSIPQNLCFVLPVLGFIGCGPGSVEEYDAFPCVEENTLCVTLEVPERYQGTPRKLSTGFYDTSDTARIPNQSLPTIDYPTIVPGEGYDLSFKDLDFTGEFYLMFILFDEDGGTFIPKANVDYTATTKDLVSVDGGPVEIGEMKLRPAD